MTLTFFIGQDLNLEKKSIGSEMKSKDSTSSAPEQSFLMKFFRQKLKD
jgi:hypothetical protein